MAEEVVFVNFNNYDVKQGLARRLLDQLKLRGYKVTPKLSTPWALNQLMDYVGLPAYSYVVLLRELCQEFRLDPVEYALQADPAGQPHFTVKARIGRVERTASATYISAAYQLAAKQIYIHLRTMLKSTNTFNEEEAIFRAYLRTMGEIDADEGFSPEHLQRTKEQQEKAEKNKQDMAVQESVLMELDKSEHSEPTLYEVAAAWPGTANAPEQDDNKDQVSEEEVQRAAIGLIQRTMERLGI